MSAIISITPRPGCLDSVPKSTVRDGFRESGWSNWEAGAQRRMTDLRSRQVLCAFPGTAWRRYHKVSGLKHICFLSSSSRGQRSDTGWNQGVSWAGCLLDVLGENLPFPASRGRLHSWFVVPSSIFRGSDSSKSSPCHVTLTSPGPLGYLGPTQIIQRNLPVLRSVN